MMEIDNQQLNQILVELGLDPNDQTARKTVQRLMQFRPNIPMNEQFFRQLREDLQYQAAHLVAQQTGAHSTSQSTNFTSMFINKILASALVVMIVVVGGGFWYIQNRTDQPLFQSPAAKEANQLLSGKFNVEEAAAESFGDLHKVSIVNATEAAKLNNNSRAISTQETATATEPGAASGSGTGASDKMVAPAPMPVPPGTEIMPPLPESYKFTYEGKDISAMLNKSQPVLKRRTPNQSGTGIASRIISMLSFGLIDLSKFNDLKIQFINFLEDRDYGYMLNVDLVQGTVNLNQNWEKWPQPEIVCVNDVSYCGPQPRFTPDTYPKDDEILQVADDFIKEYGISLEAYGKPQLIDQQWRVYYQNLAETEKANFYYPEQATIVYPLMLDGKTVLDERGNPNGLTIIVDVRQDRVISVYELTTKQFEKSTYTGETDNQRIIKIAENGGFRNYPYVDPNSQVITLKLDTPTLQYVKIWYSFYDGNTSYYGSSGELYVPALVFPIKNQGNYWRENIIVPLVKDILDTDNQGQPMPVDLPASTSSSGSADGSPSTESTPAINLKENN